ncbi:ribonuclease PH [Bacillus coahuilensis]|uniref:ribonuclease PH n=1 Tax=Bacillus coahuilensis TaxID=408580 RepID=UPI0001851186|nr:ribonuclease PH [Bacillus coahuilensis]
MRRNERKVDELRPVTIETDYLIHPEGSVLISIGQTKVICTASVEERVPPFMRGEGKGWVNAEYSMLPRATEKRTIRESSKGKVTGRTMEIQRLISRSLRAVVDLTALGERTIWIDCDVIQADGGTRTASITGAFIAMTIAIDKISKEKKLPRFPVNDFLSAISVGIDREKTVILDLSYDEDSTARVDMNVVMTGSGEFVEVQGTGEEATFTMSELQQLLSVAEKGNRELMKFQKEALGEIAGKIGGS